MKKLLFVIMLIAIGCCDNTPQNDTVIIQDNGKKYAVPKKDRIEYIYENTTNYKYDINIIRVDDSMEYLIIKSGNGTTTTRIK